MTKEKKLEFLDFYKKNRELYRKLGKRLEKFLKINFEKNDIPFYSISSRAKTRESFMEKLEKKNYKSIQDITDLCGIRIITFLESETRLVEDILREHLVIDESNSIDKSKILGEDKVGYKSIHLVATLPQSVLELPGFEKFENLKFEIQVRTILQHAWAEIEHDRNYKFSGKLPKDIKRRFKLVAGVLEIADREFESISKDIAEYESLISKKIEVNALSKIDVNSPSLKKYLNNKFNLAFPSTISPEVIVKLNKNNIYTLEDFSNIEDLDIINYFKNRKNGKLSKNYDLIILKLLEEYLEKNDIVEEE